MDKSSVVNCKECGQPIIFAKTKKGNYMPVDYASLPEHQRIAVELNEATIEYDSKIHVSHFATCSNPAKFRKKNETITKQKR